MVGLNIELSGNITRLTKDSKDDTSGMPDKDTIVIIHIVNQHIKFVSTIAPSRNIRGVRDICWDFVMLFEVRKVLMTAIYMATIVKKMTQLKTP
jgi:hypothetical protein